MKLDLTPTEFEVSAHLSSGYEAKEVARVMNKSYYTITTHKKSIFAKNDIKNVSELTMMFVLKYGDPRLLTKAS
ncbi:helix-turn-helix transcriptional regulator [Tenacibaculum sp. 190524A05c]|uniref:helix-turn-helix transcriptional regulator n=1 Tax=Tenacibaculum platacis TaxID=3137852 RepID=UPI0031FAF364